MAKYKKLVPVLTLIFEYIWGTAQNCIPDTIGAKALNMAINWAEYLESHAVKIYNYGMGKINQPAQSLLHHIKNGQLKEPFYARDVYHSKHWRGLGTPEKVQEVLNYLCEYNYLMQQP